MPIKARTPETKNKEQPMEGTHVARLLSIVDLGHQPGFSYQGKDVESEWKFEFTYELVNHHMTDGRPFVISEEVTNKDWEDKTGGLCTKLVSRSKAMCGQDYKEALKDLTKMLGQPCMVTVTHNDKGYPKIKGSAAVGSVPFGMDTPEVTNVPFIFDMDEPDMDKWESFPDFKKEKITSALNFDETDLAKTLAEGDQY